MLVMLVMLMSAVEEFLRSSLCRRQITWPFLSRILMRGTKRERQAAGNGGDPPRLRRLHPLPLASTLRPCSRRGAPDGRGWGAGWRRAPSPRSPCRLGERAGAPGSAVPPPDAAAPPLPGSYKPPRPASVGPKCPPPSLASAPRSMVWNTNLRWRLPVTCLLLQVALVVLFGVFVRYDMDADPHWIDKKEAENSTSDMENEFYYRYPSKSGHLAGRFPEAGSGAEPCLTAHLRGLLLLGNSGWAGQGGGGSCSQPPGPPHPASPPGHPPGSAEHA